MYLNLTKALESYATMEIQHKPNAFSGSAWLRAGRTTLLNANITDVLS